MALGHMKGLRVQGIVPVAILATAGWASFPAVTNLQQDCPLSARDSVTLRLYRFATGFGDSRLELRKTLGLPSAIEVVARRNQYTGMTDSLVTWDYSGLKFVLHWQARDSTEFLSSAELRNATKHVGYGIEIGSTTRRELTSLLEKPDYLWFLGDTVIYSYRCPLPCIGPDATTDFWLVSDTLRLIRWSPYTG